MEKIRICDVESQEQLEELYDCYGIKHYQGELLYPVNVLITINDKGKAKAIIGKGEQWYRAGSEGYERQDFIEFKIQKIKEAIS